MAPRSGTVLLIVGGFPGTLLISEIATLGGGLVLVYLAWVVLGYALWIETTRRSGDTAARIIVLPDERKP